MLVAVYVNLFALITDLLSLQKNVKVKIQFRSLLVKCLKRLRIVKNIKERSKRELIMTKEDEINFQMAKKLYDKKILE